MLKILAMTSIRSDYDLMSGLYSVLDNDPDIDFKILVSGAHLSPEHGFTVDNIKRDQLKILAEIETLISADSPASRLKTASCLLSSSIDIVKQFSPNVIIYAGDREDVLIGSMLAGFLGIPSIHFFGGDHATDGHIDNPVRHATSKLSSIHFVSIPKHKDRLISLGENESRIFVIGSIALDKFLAEPVVSRADLFRAIGVKSHGFGAKCAVFIFHPLADEKSVASTYVLNAIEALISFGYHVLVGASNTDPGNFNLNQILSSVSKRDEVTFYKNLERNHFVNLLRNAEIIVGNSSSGILEAASVPLPAINIGKRQKGRTAGDNVIFCNGDKKNILDAIAMSESDPFRNKLLNIRNPYGDGRSIEKAYNVIKNLNLPEFIAKSEDPLDAQTKK